MIRAWVNKNSGEIVEFYGKNATKSKLAYAFLLYVDFEPLTDWEEISVAEEEDA